MCGIVGKIDFSGGVDLALLHRMCEVIQHRGPDSRGVFVEHGVGLGVQRLAIIDVAGGDQPIFNEDRTVAVVQNGEIYNYQELRERLVRRGHSFSSQSDTEVLVHLYEEHGEAMVHHLRGMFAFAIWDARQRRLFCARDRVGKKPFFWARQGSRVWFASELRALLQDEELHREVDPSAIVAYLALQYVPHPLSVFRQIQKLPPATTLTVTEESEHLRRYWALDYSRKLGAMHTDELEELLWSQIREATRIRLMSEVPLGAFLSGGIDSSAIVAAMAEQMAQPVKTFSIGFSEATFNELSHARTVARHFGTDHHEFLVEPRALEIMPKMARHYGEPFADASAIPTFYLAELTRRHVTVALNGDGGDESFAGYTRYDDGQRAPHLNWLPAPLRAVAPLVAKIVGEGEHPSSLRTQITRLARILAMSPEERYATTISAFDDVRLTRLLQPAFAETAADCRPEEFLTRAWTASTAADPLEQMMATDVEMYLPGALLVKMDIATMAHSVEARSPLLDHHLMEFAAKLRPEFKRVGGSTKWLLKRALRSRLPPEILSRPKMGFGVPLARWFREDLRELPTDVLLDPRSLQRGYFRRAEVEDLVREHRAGIADHSVRLWVLLQLEMWHREVADVPRTPEPGRSTRLSNVALGPHQAG
jgi:asparagine synthase (glutamine-hydrolysing)